jgi:hypothetical protein
MDFPSGSPFLLSIFRKHLPRQYNEKSVLTNPSRFQDKSLTTQTIDLYTFVYRQCILLYTPTYRNIVFGVDGGELALYGVTNWGEGVKILH